ncbi:MAG: amino acid permease [Bacilli bacterium]|jgi:D-serine/D-alanine/glycine transporter|nr:amino acid permease [Bacilli bacterium]
MSAETQELQRGLSNRHLQLIAIGGAIGTGLFMGSGTTIHKAGPSILLAYLLIGCILFLIMRALGDILLSNSKYKTFVDFTKEYLGERWAFLVGWTYWLCWVSIVIADCTVCGLYIQLWIPSVPTYVPGLIILLLLWISNLITVKMFGEFEFWFALIKIIAIIALIVVGLILVFTGFNYIYTAPDSAEAAQQALSGETVTASFSHLVSNGGFFPKGAGGFFLSFQMVAFAFAGMEMLGLTAAETKDPEKNLPKAINNVPIRIAIFYIGALFVIMCIYPWNIVDPTQSPFVMVFKAAGITAAATIINAVVLTSAASACNTAIFSTSRMMYSMAENKDAPNWFYKLSKNQVPARALTLTLILAAAGVLLNYFIPVAATVFEMISSVSTVCFLFVWLTILCAHIAYKKKNPALAEKSVYKMPFFPIANYICIIFCFLVLVIMAFIPETRVGVIFTPVWFILLFILYAIFRNKKKAVQE